VKTESRDLSENEVRFTGWFDCTREELWRALIDPNELSAWLGGTARIETRVGGSVLFDLPADAIRATGTVRAYEPPRAGYRVAMLEHTFIENTQPESISICRWVVRDARNGAELVFTQDRLSDADRERLTPIWSRTLGRPVDRTDVQTRPTTTLAEARALLSAAHRILLVSFIGPEVPAALTTAGFQVFAKVGPDPDAWAFCRRQRGELEFEPRSRAPDAIDLVHLDVSDAFDEYLAVARSLGAKTFWYHSARTCPPDPHDDRGCWLPAAQSLRQRSAAEAAGLAYIDDRYIADVARALNQR
jgi:uncharacterized protein YndB with AHSA1/START domain